ncbi:serine/threonine-protein kinase [Deinococcus metalli]|uniref:Serine/threonine-protein kinase n=1 Tax=Deinococcus metalli TaxID=1141878 RepID=A0A7W8KKL0_9DEIO|nr:serine/threonine-protein kinase [Deinococcus metalli]MBB5378269.1 serine/threonine-protein kinase [Deinococcus metalli]GHF57314.1 serine/threonine protein kinase [Deinococcus metalli]
MQELSDNPALGALEPLGEHAGVLCAAAEWQSRRVFVKTLTIDDPDATLRFQHEGRVAASLDHPLIVSPLAASDRRLIFPFVAGGTLRDRLELGPLPAEQATEVVLGILHAVTYLHEQGVTHHDIKPENILLTGGEPRFWNVRLIDFGMSHSRALPLDIHSGTRMGTPHFMAPEQFRGVRGDPRSDVYSVGVLLFDCLSGHPPFEDALGWLAGLHDRLAPLPGPADLHPLLQSALSRAPAERPVSAEALRLEVCQARRRLGYTEIGPSGEHAPPCP